MENVVSKEINGANFLKLKYRNRKGSEVRDGGYLKEV